MSVGYYHGGESGVSDSLKSVAPIVEALIKYKEKASISFHVPGHKDGVGSSELARKLLGEQVFKIDATEIPGLDNLNHPTGPIRDAEVLTSKLYGTRDSIFLVNGSTSGVHAMILATCSPGEKIIISRNSHRSVIAGIILAGAEPIYVQPEFHSDFGVPLGIPPCRMRGVLDEHPDAGAILLPNPNYYGVTSDLKAISDIVHRRGRLLLIDEACGGHFVFSDVFPPSAIEIGADMCVQSMHKMGSSLTQSSILHVISNRIDVERLRTVLAMLQTSSPSYVLMASLDAARFQLQTERDMLMGKIIGLCEGLRTRLEDVPGLTCMDEHVSGRICNYHVDITKVLISLRMLGITGYELGRTLREECGIEVELEDLYNVLVSITFGNSERDIETLVSSLMQIATRSNVSDKTVGGLGFPEIPKKVMLPRDAMWSKWRHVPLCESAGEVCADIVSPYPPGVPVICPGEVVSDDIVEYLRELITQGAEIQGIRCEGRERDPGSYMLRVVNV